MPMIGELRPAFKANWQMILGWIYRTLKLKQRNPQNLGSSNSIGLAALQSPFQGVKKWPLKRPWNLLEVPCKTPKLWQQAGLDFCQVCTNEFKLLGGCSLLNWDCWAGLYQVHWLTHSAWKVRLVRPWQYLTKKARIGSVKYSKPHLCQCSRQWVLLLTTERKETHLSVPFRTATRVEQPNSPRWRQPKQPVEHVLSLLITILITINHYNSW